MKIKTIELTPKIADEYLRNRHQRQRAISKQWVGIIANRIKLGAWDKDAGCLVVDCDGKLVDGSHRCAAVIASNKTVTIGVIVAPWSYYRDDTRRRSMADRNGVSKQCAAIARTAGRIVGENDGDIALGLFRHAIESSKADTLTHRSAWGSSSVGAAIVAADGVLGSGASRIAIDRMINALPESEMERALCARAMRGTLATTGTGQMATVSAVFSTLIGKRSKLTDVSKALMDRISKK